MAEMRIGFKIKAINHEFYNAMQGIGFETVAQLSRVCGINQSTLGRYLNLKDWPRSNETCQKLEEVFELPIEFLFPSEMIEQIKKSPQTKFYIHKEIVALPFFQINPNLLTYNPRKEIERRDIKVHLEKTLDDILDTLPTREKRVLEERFGLKESKKTLEECSKIFGVTRERIRQIEAKALRMLRHPARSRKLSKFYI